MPNKRLLVKRGLLLAIAAGLCAAGLAPVGAFGPAPEAPAAPPELKKLSADAGRRITTVTIETSDPVAYLTNRPDPMTLFVDLRDVDASRARATLGAKGLVAGASVEQATGADGARVARVRIRLTSAAAHQVRSRRNLFYVDFDAAFPLGSVGAWRSISRMSGRPPRRSSSWAAGRSRSSTSVPQG
jgi:hypothetical protein